MEMMMVEYSVMHKLALNTGDVTGFCLVTVDPFALAQDVARWLSQYVGMSTNINDRLVLKSTESGKEIYVIIGHLNYLWIEFRGNTSKDLIMLFKLAWI